jgi:Caspase domain
MEKETGHGRFTVQQVFCNPDLPRLPIMMSVAEYLLTNAPRTDSEEWLDKLDSLWSQAEQDDILDIGIDGFDGEGDEGPAPARRPKVRGPQPGNGAGASSDPAAEAAEVRGVGGLAYGVTGGDIRIHPNPPGTPGRGEYSGSPPQAALPDLATSRAVLLGTGRYQHLPDLPGVSLALSGLAEAFTSTDPEVGVHRPTFAADSLTVLADEAQPTALAAVDSAASNARDTLLIYFAGHGLVSRHGELLLAAPATREDAEYTAIRYHEIRELIVRSPAHRKLMIIDCCYSGRALTVMGTVSSLAEAPSTYVLTSTSPYRASLTSDTGMPSFTGMLIEILTRGTPIGPELLTVSDIYEHIRTAARREGLPIPRYRGLDSPAQRPLALTTNRAFFENLGILKSLGTAAAHIADVASLGVHDLTSSHHAAHGPDLDHASDHDLVDFDHGAHGHGHNSDDATSHDLASDHDNDMPIGDDLYGDPDADPSKHDSY